MSGHSQLPGISPLQARGGRQGGRPAAGLSASNVRSFGFPHEAPMYQDRTLETFRRREPVRLACNVS